MFLGCKESPTSQTESQETNTRSTICSVTQLQNTPEAWSLTPSSSRIFLLGDLAGNLNAVFEPSELSTLSHEISTIPDDAFSCHRKMLLEAIEATKAKGGTLTPPTDLQRTMTGRTQQERQMLMRADLEWGDANGITDAKELIAAQEVYARLSDIFPNEASALRVLRNQGNAAPNVPPQGMRALAARLLTSAIKRSSFAAPWLNTQSLYHAPQWHQFSVLEHTARTKEVMELLLAKLNISWSDGPVLMALHDIGKISHRNWKAAAGDSLGGFAFDTHATLGASILRDAGWELGGFLVENHEAIRKRSIDEIAVLTPDAQVRQYLALVFAADNLGKGSTPMLDKELKEVLIPKLLTIFERVGLSQNALMEFVTERGYPH
jgi:hypothetical protein